MKRIFILLLLLSFLSPAALSDSYIVGGTELNIPSPIGYVRVTTDMGTVYRYLMQLKDPQNDVLAYYILQEDASKATEGAFPQLSKYFILKVNKQLKSAMVSSKEFADLQRVTIQQNKEIFESVESKIPGQLENISEGISKEFDIDFAMKMSQFVPLDVHYTDDNTLAYSMYINYGVTAQGSSEKIILSATDTFLNTAGKVIFLYCYAPKAELEWTRSASKLWAESILAGNPSPPLQSSSRHRIKWKKVVEKCVIGAVGGGLTALVAVLIKNKKRSDQQTDSVEPD